MKRKNKVVTVCDRRLDNYTIREYCEMVNKDIKTIPSKYIDSTKIIFDIEDGGNDGYHSHSDYCVYRIFYLRPETDEEYEIRRTQHEHDMAMIKLREEIQAKLDKEREDAEKVRESKMPKIIFSI